MLVLVKLQTAPGQLKVKLAVGPVLGGAGSTLTEIVLELLRPPASRTVRVALKTPAAVYVKEALSVVASAVPSPLKSQLHAVTAT